jgi:hypothetical protein
MARPVLDEPVAAAHRIEDALDYVRFDEIARLAGLAASYWHSVELAADRGDLLTLAVHTKQVVSVTREALTLVGTLGSGGASS